MNMSMTDPRSSGCACATQAISSDAGCAPLHTLSPGQSATIQRIRASGELGRRLRDMGLFLGVRLTLVGPAPLGDPIAITMDGYDLSLRQAEAAQILVQPIALPCKSAGKE